MEQKKSKKARVPETIRDAQGNEINVKLLQPHLVEKERVVRKVVRMANELSAMIEQYQTRMLEQVLNYLNGVADNYGEAWKGNAVLRTLDESQEVELSYAQLVTYDEKLQIAGEVIRGWIDGKLKKVKDEGVRNILEQVSSIAKDALSIESGKRPDRKKIVKLKKFEFTGEPEWEKAMQLISESERLTGTKKYMQFRTKDEQGKVIPIKVNFSDF